MEGRTGTVTPSATFGYITLTSKGFWFNTDDVGLELYCYKQITDNGVTTDILVG